MDLRASVGLLAGVAFLLLGGCDSSTKGNSVDNTLHQAPCFGGRTGSTVPESGYVDAAGSLARFCEPNYLAIDSGGSVYISDTSADTIRKMTPNGVVSTFAGTPGVSGSADGIGTAAQFKDPRGVAFDSHGDLFVADRGNGLIRKITPAGEVTTVAGIPGAFGDVDGDVSVAVLHPVGMAFDSSDNLYFTERSSVRRLTPGGVVSTLATGVAAGPDGTGEQCPEGDIQGVAIGQDGTVFLADDDSVNGYGVGFTICMITPAGDAITLAGSPGHLGSVDGTGAEARFDGPRGLALDVNGDLYVSDGVVFISGFLSIVSSTIRKVTPTGVVTTLAGHNIGAGWADGVGTEALFQYPSGIAFDSNGTLLIADMWNFRIRAMTPDLKVTTVAGPNAVPALAAGAPVPMAPQR